MSEAKCPVAHGANSNMEKSSADWWPKNLNLRSEEQPAIVLSFKFK